jgi:tetratricopeptide (TPR) repeat protein
MAKRRHARARKKQQKLDSRRRLKKKRKRNPTMVAKAITPKLADKVDDAYDLIGAGQFAEAEQLLDRLEKQYHRYQAITEAQLYLYQTSENHECCCQTAKRLANLTPRDPDARLMYAQESMFCGRIGIALTNYQLFLQHWPDHANSQKSKNAIELIEPECEANIQGMGFGDAGLELLIMHEEVLKLFMAKIHWEATQCATPWVQEFVETGTEALKRGDFTLAEKSFNRVLDKEPDNCSAAYNLCVVWLERDGKSGRRRAQARMEEIHEQFPDYLFAPISLAQFAAMDGDLTRASDLLEPILDAKTLHVTEAIALFTAQVQIAIRRHEFDSAEQSLALLVQIAGEDDPKVATLRRRIDAASGRRGLSRLLSWV